VAKLVLTCGLAGSGKSTYAKSLEAQGWLRLSIDVAAWELGYTSHPLPSQIRDEIVARQQAQLAAALSAGQNVVVDYAFYSRTMRDEYRALGHQHGAEVEVVCFQVARDELLTRLAQRETRSPGPDDALVTEALLDRFIAGFEWPGSDETDVKHL
jgi:predicted kinase